MPYSLQQLPFRENNFYIHCGNNSSNNSKIHTSLTFWNMFLIQVSSKQQRVRGKERFGSTHPFRIQSNCSVSHLYHKVNQGLYIQEKREEEISEVSWISFRSEVHHICLHSTGKDLITGHTSNFDKINKSSVLDKINKTRILYTDYNYVHSNVLQENNRLQKKY